MFSTYTLDTDELPPQFIEVLQRAFYFMSGVYASHPGAGGLPSDGFQSPAKHRIFRKDNTQ